jgi:chemotaxis methyl-accepting protein methylase
MSVNLLCAAGDGGASRPSSSGHAAVFFRGEHHFQQLAVRARTLAGHRTTLKVWCCTCGTGEDAYSAAMALREAGCQGDVLATDADGEALAVARRGMYGLAAVEGLGEERLQRHFFVRGADDASPVALVRGELRAMVRFTCHDLRADTPAPDDHFDFIFFRDALPELEGAARRRILERLAAALVHGGVLFLGQADSAGLSHPELVPCGRTAYERRAPPPADA